MKKSHASKLAAPIHRVSLTLSFALSTQHQHFGPARLSSARCGDPLSPCAELSIVWRSAANPLRIHLLLAVTLARARQRIELASVESWRVQELRAVAVNVISRAIGKKRELANVMQQFENAAHGFFGF